jgi:hypothetical protein
MSENENTPSSNEPMTAKQAKALRPFYKKPIFIILAVVIALFAFNAVSGGDSETASTDTPSATQPSAPAVVESAAPAETQAPEETVSQANAVRAAENYLSFAPFSREGLIKQLEFEEYSTEDATYGVDAQSADWNEQAAKSAKNYLDISPFSREGMIEQLEFEGYTTAEAEYGATANGL